MSDELDFLKGVYDRFNARDMETVLAAMHEDVVWAKLKALSDGAALATKRLWGKASS